jgi:hypothetical protein
MVGAILLGSAAVVLAARRGAKGTRLDQPDSPV